MPAACCLFLNLAAFAPALGSLKTPTGQLAACLAVKETAASLLAAFPHRASSTSTAVYICKLSNSCFSLMNSCSECPV